MQEMIYPIKIEFWSNGVALEWMGKPGLMMGFIRQEMINNGVESVMQFTGLFDKNGKEIYEGDILNSYNGTLQGAVFYQAPSFIVKRKRNAKTWFGFNLHYTERQFQEVIGNIYENPKLLK